MHRTFLITALLATLAATPAPAETGLTLIPGFSHPESVLIAGERRFVSNIGTKLDPLAHDGDGFISELDAEGRIVALRAFPAEGRPLDAPKGMAVLDGVLYVADINRVAGFDLSSRRQVFEARLEGHDPALLNDLAAMEGDLAVSDTLSGTIWRLDVKSRGFSLLATGLPGVNGLAWNSDRQHLLAAGLGARFEGGDLFAVSPQGKVEKLEKSPHGVFDGLALLADGHLLLSDWRSIDPPTPGALTLHTADGHLVKTLDFGHPLQGPADFAIDPETRRLWLPLTLSGKLLIAPLPDE